MKIKGRRVIFGNPQPVDVLIFDEVNSQYVRKAINKKYSIGIFHVRPEDIFIAPLVFFHFLVLLPRIQFKEIKSSDRGWLISLFRQLKLMYFIACFVIIRPKAIVTLIDNSCDFHWLSKNCRRFHFIAIQNGSRLSFMSVGQDDYHLQHFFCFGEHEKSQFSRIKYTVENFYPVGSLIASLHFADPKTITQQYDILVLSAWRGNIGFPQDAKDTMRSMRIMDELLSKYLEHRKLKAAIILRSERNGQHWFVPEIGSNEEDYFNGIYGITATVIETDFSKRNIFPLMQESRLIISCLTSALLEGFGIGKKALFCNFTGTDKYHLDFDPAIITTDRSFEKFSKQLDELLAMPQKVYDQEYRELQQYYMHFPEKNTTYEVIADTIDDIIRLK
jgi:surface carbohydrate biosynthesis protein